MVISSAFLPQKQYVFYTEKQVFWLWHALSNLGGKKKNNQSMEITKQVKQKQRIFNILTQEEIFRSFISTDHCTLGLLFPKGPDILNAARTLRNISSCRKSCC